MRPARTRGRTGRSSGTFFAAPPKARRRAAPWRDPQSAPARRRIHRNTTAALGIALATVLAGCHSTPPPTPLAQLNAQQTEGYAVFQSRCAVCHYERVAKAKNGPSLRGVLKHPYLPSGAPANDERITATVLHGHGLMPAQPNIDPESLAALLAYLHTV